MKASRCILSAFSLLGLSLFVVVADVCAQGIPDPGGSGGSDPYGPTRLCSWSFSDTNFWTSGLGFSAISSSNAVASVANGTAVLLDGENIVPTLLQYRTIESNGATNLNVANGSLSFWIAPTWASADTNREGMGPGDWGSIIEIGRWSQDASFGWWSLYFDPAGTNIYFSSQSGGMSATYLTAPISWSANDFHYVALSYCATNTALYIDGSLATNGPGLSCVPGAQALAGGFFLGSDADGLKQARATFDDLQTFNGPMDSMDAISGFVLHSIYYLALMEPPFHSADPVPPINGTNVISGSGYLQSLGGLPNWTAGASVSIRCIAYSPTNNGTFTFGIDGGSAGLLYDVFATSILQETNGQWSWMGQGNAGNIYSMDNLASKTVFLILGSSQDSDGDGLSDAYEKLVSHSNPNNPDTDGDGIPDGWEFVLGSDFTFNDWSQNGLRANYSYTLADWLDGVSGKRSGGVSMDNEGNVLQVSQ